MSSACVASTATTSSELPAAEKRVDEIAHDHDYGEAAAGPGHRSAEMHFCDFILNLLL